MVRTDMHSDNSWYFPILAQIRFIWAYSQSNLAGLSEQIFFIILNAWLYETCTKSYMSAMLNQ